MAHFAEIEKGFEQSPEAGLKAFDGALLYFEGLIDREINPVVKANDENTFLTLTVLGSILEILAGVGKKFNENNKKLNELTDRIQRLETRMNEYDKLR